MGTKNLPEVVSYAQEVDSVVALGQRGILARFQCRDLIVISIDLYGSDLTSLICIAPAGYVFGQEYWLGQAYLSWHLTYGLTKENFDSVVESFRTKGLELADVPYAIVNFGSGAFTNAGLVRSDWDRNIFQTFVVPTYAASAAQAAIEASADLVRAFLYEPDSTHLGVDALYGEAQLEKIFSRQRFGYRRPPNLMAPSSMNLGIDYLRKQLADVRHIAEELDSGTLDRATNWRWLTYRPLDCREFDRSQRNLVAEINLEKARLINRLELPHFYYELFLRRIDTSLNRALSSYRFVKNDMDWLENLHHVSPESFSADFEERSILLGYIDKMQKRYPFMANDPLRGILPSVKLSG